MIFLFFFLKFKSQLNRTRPEIIRHLDETFKRSIADAGGKVTGDRFVFSAVFKKEQIGFWLDMYILIENLKKTIEKSKDFFGYSLVITNKIPAYPDMLCRFLANRSGVFMSEKSAKYFIPYATFEKPSEWLKGIKKRKYGSGAFFRIKELKDFKKISRVDPELQNKINKVFEQKNGKNKLILGSSYSQLQTGLNNYCSFLNGDFPALTIFFGSTGLGPLIDAWSISIRSLGFSESSSKLTNEIEKLWEFLFRERIRDEFSEYVVRCTRRFLSLIFKYYFDAAESRKKTPVLVLENIHSADRRAAQILFDSMSELNPENKNDLVILGIGDNDCYQDNASQWEYVFDYVTIIDEKYQNKNNFSKLSNEFWEIIYAISLLGRFFSPELFLRLFEEDEKNPVMITRAFSILQNLGLIDNLREPRLLYRELEEQSYKALGERAEKIKEFVRRQLFNWAGRRNINPCFRLLAEIACLDGINQIDDLLLLKSISADVINETISGIETALNNGQLEEIIAGRAAAARNIFYSSKALYLSKENEIEKIFSDNQIENIIADCEQYPVLKTQILNNIGTYYLGKYMKKEAGDKIKEAIILGQKKNVFCIPQSYRIFSLVCLLKKQINESIEYIGFALLNAKKTDNYQELAVSSYYAAAIQFLYGDIYNAAKFAKESVEHSLAAGYCEWADHSRFLEGRINFELGYHQKALEIFENLRKEPFGNITCEKDSLLAAWIYRCNIYYQNSAIPKPNLASHDADLFEIEASFLSGSYHRAIELASEIKTPVLNENFLYTEQVDWRSGFAQCENLYFTNGEIQDRMIKLFCSLSLSRLPEKKCEEALAGIKKILSDEKLCEMDPWDAFYYFAKYLILEQTNASLIDKSTAVSMAFKRLQRRAGRIEDVETCRKYINGSRWNRELSLAAKEFNLI